MTRDEVALILSALTALAGCTTLSGADRFAVGDGGSAGKPNEEGGGGEGGNVNPCDNGIQDPTEDGVDCGGACPACAPVCGDGMECETGFCVQGICCNEACEGSCHSCRAADTIGPDGVCLPAKPGTDPKNSCANAPSEDLCGQTGSCDGAGQCAFAAEGTICAPALCAGPESQSNPSTCDGAGSCEENGESACAPYACDEINDTGCLTACATSADCLDGNDYCDGTGACVAKKPDLATCAIDDECSNGYCNLDIDQCLPAQCDNGAQDVGETDTDCGGVCKNTCLVGETCSVNADCLGNDCNQTTLVCQ
jgi:hypothetical protein